MSRLLSPRRVAAWRAAPLTYDEVGASLRTDDPPAGFHAVRRSAVLHRRDFDGAAADLMAWRLQEWAGVGVAASGPTVTRDAVVELRLGWGPLAVRAPCRVVELREEPGVAGFAYGTLPGHPESGEESFLLERLPDGRLRVSIAAFSRPATALARLGGPITSRVQRWVTTRYLGSLDRPPEGRRAS